jgi:outer membrane protein assembly factor BamD
MNRRGLLFFTLLLLIFFNSCKFQKNLKNPDIEEKYKAALEYYNAKDYSHALQLFDQMIGVIRATDKAEDLSYFYPYCYYNQKDYTLAAYYFKRYYTTFPGSSRAEECLYMSAYCNCLNSPEYSLDQTSTYDAIKELQLFIDIYPKSKRVSECNDLIDALRQKLELKAYKIARMYSKMSDYTAAIVSYQNILKDFPETPHKEEVLFQILKTDYKYAAGSVDSKKKERFNKAISAYNDLVKEFPQTPHLKESKEICDKSKKEIELLNSMLTKMN